MASLIAFAKLRAYLVVNVILGVHKALKTIGVVHIGFHVPSP
jgi:hypothetical protein